MQISDRDFINVKANIQRLSDSKLFSGWVEDFQFPYISIRCQTDTKFTLLEEFHFELQGEVSTCTFYGMLANLDGMEQLKQILGAVSDIKVVPDITLEFRAVTQKSYTAPKESFRKAVHELTGTLVCKAGRFEVDVSDVSHGGAGVLVPAMLEIGDVVDLSITTMMRCLKFECQVKSCRQDPRTEDSYFAGLEFGSMSRIDAAAWARLMDAA